MGKQVSIPDGYLPYISQHSRYGMFYNERNKRKVMILAVLLENPDLTAHDLMIWAGKGCMYSSLRSVIAGLAHWQYIGYRMRGRDRAYHILSKGARLIYACQELEPDKYQEWVALIRQPVNSPPEL